MNTRERFENLLNGRETDGLPVIEWASWWKLTMERWLGEGLPAGMSHDGIYRYFGLDVHNQIGFRLRSSTCPSPTENGGGIIENTEDYEKILPHLYNFEENERYFRRIEALKPAREAGDTALWFTLEGAFWFPRKLFGIMNHLYSFYDEPELYRRILDDLADFEIRIIRRIYEIDTPEFMTFAEDMSYNHGSMISEQMFDEFLLPFYRRVIPEIHKHGTKVIIDSDGDITGMVPWLIRAGIDGVLPLEWQAGVDIAGIRAAYPEFIMIGGFNKRIMKDGEAAMRAEFERILPVMKAGRYIPAVDHQTPPDVPLETYKVYVRLLKEYCGRL